MKPFHPNLYVGHPESSLDRDRVPCSNGLLVLKLMIAHPLKPRFLLVLWGVIMAFGIYGVTTTGSASESEPKHRAGHLDDEITHLSDTWRMDPLDESIAIQIARIRQDLGEQQSAALTELVRGLMEFLVGRAHIAANHLSRVRQSREAEVLADSLLLQPLADLEQQARIAANLAGIDGMCLQCGDSGFQDCPNRLCWKSFGHLTCNTCQGSGRNPTNIKSPRNESDICTTCQGSSATTCSDCAGDGLLVCDKCHLPLLDALTDDSIAAIRRLRAIATYLALGGPDFYSPGALTPSAHLSR